MPVDMKKVIADAAWKLVTEKKVKKLTVKDIVEECHITRQTFYYHFEDIPALLRWIMEHSMNRLMQEARKQNGPEEALRYFFLVTINAAPYIRKGVLSNYGDEFKVLLKEQIYRMLEQAAEETELYRGCSQFQLQLILRYHSLAILGLIMDWTEKDTKHLDEIVHQVYRLMTDSSAEAEQQCASHTLTF